MSILFCKDPNWGHYWQSFQSNSCPPSQAPLGSATIHHVGCTSVCHIYPSTGSQGQQNSKVSLDCYLIQHCYSHRSQHLMWCWGKSVWRSSDHGHFGAVWLGQSNENVLRLDIWGPHLFKLGMFMVTWDLQLHTNLIHHVLHAKWPECKKARTGPLIMKCSLSGRQSCSVLLERLGLIRLVSI